MNGHTIGAIADDYTGGTDVAAAFRRQGLRTVLLFGPPDDAILTAYYAMRVGELPMLPYHAPGDQSLGAVAELAAARHHALLLANHGPIVAGADLASAADALEEIEETAKLYLLLQGHAVRPVTNHEAQRLNGLYR
jgi:3-dehydro-4-phosphotetronate decarboxylase